MTVWIILFAIVIAALAAAPFLIERARQPMDEVARNQAPGHFATLSQGVTHFEWHGPVNGQIAVLIHGLTTPSWVFSGLVHGVTMMGFRVLTYDLYGRGYSDRPRGPQTSLFFQQQLNDLLNDQNVDRDIVLLGYSMGGAIATAFAAKNPKKVDRLILLAPAGFDYVPSPLLKAAGKWGLFGDWLWGLLGAWEVRRGVRNDPKRLSAVSNIQARMAFETSKRGFLPSVLSSERHMLSIVQEREHRELAKEHLSVTSIWGEVDTVIPLSSLGKLTEWNRYAYKFVLPDADHSLGYTSADEILEAIQENLREV